MFEAGYSIRCVKDIRVISKEEFDRMWSKALPVNRRLDLTLPVLNVLQDGVLYVHEGHLQTRNGEVSNRFSAFNPDERLVIQTLLEDHANTVSGISRAMAGPADIHTYLTVIEALENECKKVGNR